MSRDGTPVAVFAFFFGSRFLLDTVRIPLMPRGKSRPTAIVRQGKAAICAVLVQYQNSISLAP